MAKKIFNNSAKTFVDEDGSKLTESIYVFCYEDEDEADDFELLSHNEQLAELGFKESKTPNTENGSVSRYYIDFSSAFIVVRESKFEW